MAVNTAELVAAGWPILVAIVGGFAFGVYAWANTKRDASEALKLGEANAKAIADLATKTEHHGEQIAVLVVQHKEISDGIKWMRANWWPRRHNRK